ncbi:MAG: peptidoglycan DD-metalloendopeptidase family protein [Candidatus Marinimicrobia bacterium]|nr:peptidoglycan DD-metalloendopeptidase family protein [Candidatus Neomarinimicrobiota bacterium]MBL7023667.1 peptidoglycan DD-metalloendopeptidase family protein [Candidatus Neomarinimicrobiota bacterium]MBL7109842.1 peptidoglycan DD-metalloendopeptidase family protein [Candidatus Neomarinimicrobiota bacterium]
MRIHILIILILFSFISGQKSSKEIQKDIDARNSELNSLRKEIQNVEKNIISKTNEAISTTEKLLDLEQKINLTEKLIKSLTREERFVSEQIYNLESEIQAKQKHLRELKLKLEKRVIHLYKNGRPSLLETILLSDNWNDLTYRTKYLSILSDAEQKLSEDIQKAIVGLEDKNNNYKVELNRKRELRREKQSESSNLEKDKKTRKRYLKEIEEDKNRLENELSNKKKMITEIEGLIGKLLKDKNESKRREVELARKRAEQHKATSGNFASQKKKLPWPVQGKVITHFGNQRNNRLNTITENTGIDIKATEGAKVSAVLDGMITTITYLRGFGNLIIVDHGGGYLSVYAHIDNIIVHENDYVQQGDVLAEVSNYGSLDGSKLHFEIWGNKQKLDPEKWLIKK